MTFDEVVRYLQGAVGHRVDVHAWPNRVGEIGVHLAGAVVRVAEKPARGRESRFFCQVGEETGNGFWLSPDAFKRAGMDLADPETLGLFISLQGDYQLVIEDARFAWKDGEPGPLPS